MVRVAAGMGITKVRITGGEPWRKGVVSLVRQVAAIEGIRDIALTTNGTVLEGYAQELAAAGLKRVNVSLDTLRPETFAELTRGGDLGAVLRGIAAAERAGLCPVKINTVALKGINSDEIESMAALTLEHPWTCGSSSSCPSGKWRVYASTCTHRRSAAARDGHGSRGSARGHARTSEGRRWARDGCRPSSVCAASWREGSGGLHLPRRRRVLRAVQQDSSHS